MWAGWGAEGGVRAVFASTETSPECDPWMTANLLPATPSCPILVIPATARGQIEEAEAKGDGRLDVDPGRVGPGLSGTARDLGRSARFAHHGGGAAPGLVAAATAATHAVDR